MNARRRKDSDEPYQNESWKLWSRAKKNVSVRNVGQDGDGDGLRDGTERTSEFSNPRGFE